MSRHFPCSVNSAISTGLLACLVVSSAPLFAQGFGTLKTKVTLHRKLPPTAHLSGPTVKVQVAAAGSSGDMAPKLQEILAAELLKNDARLRTEDAHPDNVVECSITGYEGRRAQTTTSDNAIEFGKNAKPQQYTRITSMLSVSYKARDLHAGRVLDANNVTAKYDQQFSQSQPQSQKQSHSLSSLGGSITGGLHKMTGKKSDSDQDAQSPPSDEELKQHLLMQVAQDIAAHLVNTDEKVDVYLARGKDLDQANKLAENGLWDRDLETLEQMQPSASKEDDAFRLYNIGVAYEALAYQAEDPKIAKKFLEKAAINYGKAIDARPSEKYFLQPQNRIETAMAHYKILREEKPTLDASSHESGKEAAKDASTPAAMAKPAGESGGGALTNQQVIDLLKAGVDETNIIVTIRSAPAVKFDLSVDGQIDLAKNGVHGPILTAMRARAARGRAASAH